MYFNPLSKALICRLHQPRNIGIQDVYPPENFKGFLFQLSRHSPDSRAGEGYRLAAGPAVQLESLISDAPGSKTDDCPPRNAGTGQLAVIKAHLCRHRSRLSTPKPHHARAGGVRSRAISDNLTEDFDRIGPEGVARRSGWEGSHPDCRAAPRVWI